MKGLTSKQTSSLREKIINLYKSGTSLKKCSAEIGVSYSYCWKTLDEAEIKRRAFFGEREVELDDTRCKEQNAKFIAAMQKHYPDSEVRL